MSTQIDRLYARAIAADERYQNELLRAYGARLASDARYYRRHDDPAVTEAAAKKLEADDKLLRAMRREREGATPRRANPARKKTPARKRAARRKAPARKAPARRKAANPQRAPGSRRQRTAKTRYVAVYGGGKKLEFSAAGDGAAMRYANGLGKHRAGGRTLLSLKAYGPAAAPRARAGRKKKA